jgi:hypothetical protein
MLTHGGSGAATKGWFLRHDPGLFEEIVLLDAPGFFEQGLDFGGR